MSDEVSVPSRATWVPRERVLAALVQADPELRHELDAALDDAIDDPHDVAGTHGSRMGPEELALIRRASGG
jgi:hypothetical protein